MGWQDRDYASGGSRYPLFSESPLLWLLGGRLFLFRFWRVNVYAHAFLLVVSVLVLIGGSPFGATASDRFIFIITLFGIVLLHEFGHIAGARMTGGTGEEIVMTPLGGLAMAQPDTGWYSHTITIICGPAVNVIICIVAGAVLFATTGWWPLGPFDFLSQTVAERVGTGFYNVGSYALNVYAVSYFLLLFNMLPIYPLDGGQTLQGILWKFQGYYKATVIATTVGMIGGVLMGLYGLSLIFSGGGGGFLVAIIGIGVCFMVSLQVNRAVKAAGPYAFAEQDDEPWRASLKIDPDAPPKQSFREKRAQKREEARVMKEAEQRERSEKRLDELLAKISAKGIDSLSAGEKRELESMRQAKR